MKCSTGSALIFANGSYLGFRGASSSAVVLMSSAGMIAMTVSATNANITYHGTLTSASDRRLKTDIEDVSMQSCLSMLSAVKMKVYKRIDTPEEMTQAKDPK